MFSQRYLAGISLLLLPPLLRKCGYVYRAHEHLRGIPIHGPRVPQRDGRPHQQDRRCVRAYDVEGGDAVGLLHDAAAQRLLPVGPVTPWSFSDGKRGARLLSRSRCAISLALCIPSSTACIIITYGYMHVSAPLGGGGGARRELGNQSKEGKLSETALFSNSGIIRCASPSIWRTRKCWDL